ncbi:MAG TPA: carboxypeptidase-like regulatory domain-containing protein, partial [Bryobacteraceae bacterium]
MAVTAAAQVTSGSLEGVVVDESGIPLAGASIRLTHSTQSVERQASSLERGLFRFEQLPIGTYLLECSKDGYSPAKAEVRVSVGETASVTATLQAAVKFESTTTVARKTDLRIASVDRAGSELSTLFEGSRIVQLPLARRDPAELLQTLGAVPISNQNLYGTYTVGGLRPRDTSYNVDGSSNDYGIQSGPRTPVIPEAVDEFRVVTNVYSAQFGKGPGAVLDL